MDRAPAKGSIVYTRKFGKCTVLRTTEKTAVLMDDDTDTVRKQVRFVDISETPFDVAPSPPAAPAGGGGVKPQEEKTTHGTATAIILLVLFLTCVNIGIHWYDNHRPSPSRSLIREAVRLHYPELVETELVDKLIYANDGTLTTQELIETVEAAAPIIQKHTWTPIADLATSLQDANGVYSEEGVGLDGKPTGNHRAKLDALLKDAKKELQACRQ